MTLSLSILANYLPRYNITTHISESDKYTRYRRPRLIRRDGNFFIVKIEKTKTVNIYGDFPNSYISYESDDVNLVTEKVLDIFEMFDDWDQLARQYIERDDYNNFIELMYTVFNNPCFMQNTQGRVLGITRKVDGESIRNPEWTYMVNNGYATVRSINKYRKGMGSKAAITSSSATRVYRGLNNPDHAALMVSNLCCSGVVYGRITLMEYYRELNEGDAQLLQIYSDQVSNRMHIANQIENSWQGSSILSNILDHQSVSEKDYTNLISQYKLSGDNIYRVIVLDYREDADDNTLSLIEDYCSSLFPGTPLVKYKDRIIMLIKESSGSSINAVKEKLSSTWLNTLPLSIGVSLGFKNLHNIFNYYLQGIFANKFNDKAKFSISMFYDHGFDYMLMTDREDLRLTAIHPDILMLANTNQWDKHETLYSYILNERSPSRTAEELHIHKNTLLYRISEIKKIMCYDFDNIYDRKYILISMMVYNSYLMKKEMETEQEEK